MNVDPDLPVSILDQYVSRAFAENADDTIERATVRATVIRRLQTGSIRRYVNKVKE
jgi:hypothetical protein